MSVPFWMTPASIADKVEAVENRENPPVTLMFTLEGGVDGLTDENYREIARLFYPGRPFSRENVWLCEYSPPGGREPRQELVLKGGPRVWYELRFAGTIAILREVTYGFQVSLNFETSLLVALLPRDEAPTT